MSNLVSMSKMFLIFFKIGLFTIGGGLAMIPIMRDEFIEKYHWLEDEELTDIFALSQSMPGAIAINAATMIGHKLGGFKGAAIATLGTVMPSFIVIFFIFWFFTSALGDNYYLNKVFSGINGGITALILAATLKMAKSAIRDGFGVCLAVAGFIAMMFLNLDIGVLVLFAAAFGYIYYRWREGLILK